MIRRIICPIDFSPAAENATLYAAKVAQTLHAGLVLVNLRSRAVLDPVLSAVTGEQQKINDEAAFLRDRCEDVARAYRVSCIYEIDVTRDSVGDYLRRAETEDTLVVMGTNGADSFAQELYGSNSFEVIVSSKVPVWVVPERCEYGTIGTVLFNVANLATDHLSLRTLRPVLDAYKPFVVFHCIVAAAPDPMMQAALEDRYSRMLPDDVFFRFDYEPGDGTLASLQKKDARRRGRCDGNGIPAPNLARTDPSPRPAQDAYAAASIPGDISPRVAA